MSTHLPRRAAYLAAALVLAIPLGCSSGSDRPKTTDDPGTGAVAASQRPHLQWKRYSAIEADLSQALELAPDQLCTEFGVESCINGVHLAPLGGNEPFKTGLLEASAEPLATTPAVIDRLLLSACGHRVASDQAGDAKVFGALDLAGSAPGPNDKATTEVVTQLYHRFLARNPTADELARVASLTQDDGGNAVPATEFATTACFAIGSTTEFEFY
jgi:hypothetical protein